jgi:hypothetical protein
MHETLLPRMAQVRRRRPPLHCHSIEEWVLAVNASFAHRRLLSAVEAHAEGRKRTAEVSTSWLPDPDMNPFETVAQQTWDEGGNSTAAGAARKSACVPLLVTFTEQACLWAEV